MLVYGVSIYVTNAVGIFAVAKLGQYIGSAAAGPVGYIIGAIAGTIACWIVDYICDSVIDGIVDLFS